jgi:cytidine deaminase
MKPDDLVARAVAAREHAYAPYSDYRVGAAVLTESGEVFTGANVENASFGLTVCAERSAIFSAVSAGHRTITQVAVVAEGGARMCGACRQVAMEFGPRAVVHLSGTDGDYLTHPLTELLPGAFRKETLRP